MFYFFPHIHFSLFKVAKLAPVYKRMHIVVTFANFTVVCWWPLVREHLMDRPTDIRDSYIFTWILIAICFRDVNMDSIVAWKEFSLWFIWSSQLYIFFLCCQFSAILQQFEIYKLECLWDSFSLIVSSFTDVEKCVEGKSPLLQEMKSFKYQRNVLLSDHV